MGVRWSFRRRGSRARRPRLARRTIGNDGGRGIELDCAAHLPVAYLPCAAVVYVAMDAWPRESAPSSRLSAHDEGLRLFEFCGDLDLLAHACGPALVGEPERHDAADN